MIVKYIKKKQSDQTESLGEDIVNPKPIIFYLVTEVKVAPPKK